MEHGGTYPARVTGWGRRAPRALGLTLLAGAILAGCSTEPIEGTAFELENASGTIISTDEGPALELSGTVLNTSAAKLDGVELTMVTDESLDSYIPFGTPDFPIGTFDDFYPEDTTPSDVPAGGTRGMELHREIPLNTTSSALAEALEQPDVITVKVTWDGFEQTLSFGMVEDPDGILED